MNNVHFFKERQTFSQVVSLSRVYLFYLEYYCLSSFSLVSLPRFLENSHTDSAIFEAAQTPVKIIHFFSPSELTQKSYHCTLVVINLPSPSLVTFLCIPTSQPVLNTLKTSWEFYNLFLAGVFLWVESSTLDQWFPTRADFALIINLTVSEEIIGHHNWVEGDVLLRV